jgi:hypothetical protein
MSVRIGFELGTPQINVDDIRGIQGGLCEHTALIHRFGGRDLGRIARADDIRNPRSGARRFARPGATNDDGRQWAAGRRKDAGAKAYFALAVFGTPADGANGLALGCLSEP